MRVYKEVPFTRIFTKEDSNKILGPSKPFQGSRWAIEIENNQMRFYRTWTGTEIFRVNFHHTTGVIKTYNAFLNRDPEEYRSTNDDQDLNDINELIDHMLFSIGEAG